MSAMLRSDYRPIGPVVLPYAGRQFYMHGFDLAHPQMPKGYEDYLQVVESLVSQSGVSREGTAYLTVDEKVVTAGMSQRRPGPHVDGCFEPARNRWGHGGWNHYCNHLPVQRMPIIVAASVAGCKAWRGDFDAVPCNDGDLSHVPLGEGELLQPNVGYLLTPDCIHESLRFDQETQRTFIRIALPVGAA